MRLLVTDTFRALQPVGDAANGGVPKDWFDVLRAVAFQLGDIEVQKLTVRSVFGGGIKKGVVLAWNPNSLVVAAGYVGHRVIYLCWGVPDHSARLAHIFKLARLRSILFGSSAILVNDPVTKADVYRLSGREAIQIPYVVDADFFQRPEGAVRSNALLVPGSNDRDEGLVTAIANASSRPVFRVTQSKAVANIHAGSRVEVKFNISYRALAAQYHSASCVLLPIRSGNHAAGQTAMLEAIASGAPVVVSRGRTSALVEKYANVIVPSSDRLDDWLNAIARADDMVLHRQQALSQSATEIKREHAPDVVAKALLRLISGTVV